MKLGAVFASLCLASSLMLASGAYAQPVDASLAPGVERASFEAEVGGNELYEVLRQRFGEPEVVRFGGSVTVSFIDKETGHLEVFEFTQAAPQTPGAQSYASGHTWVNNGWVLSRYETDKMSRDASKFAAIYAVAALIPGAQVAIVGAAIEGAWSAHAASYYSRGNCIKIYPWLTVSEAKRGSRGCY